VNGKPTPPPAELLAVSKAERRSNFCVMASTRQRVVILAGLIIALCATSFCARAATATLGWNASTSGGVAGYKVYQGTSSGNYTSSINAGNATQATASNLVSGTTYYFAVTAYTGAGAESAYSTEISYTPTAGTNSPPPTNSTPPTVTLTAPANGSSYSGPANVTLAASVVTNGHSIAKVQFYQGATLLGEDVAPPYSYTWSGVAAGSYTLSATLIYDTSLTVSSGTATISVTNAPSQPPSSSGGGLVAAYSFDEGIGSTVSDSSGAGNNGSIQGATWASTGKFGKALSFNGTSSSVRINDSVSLHLTNGMTLEAWVYPTALGNWDEIIYKGDDDYFLEAATPQTAGPAVGLGSTSKYPMLSTANSLALNTWTHIAGTYDGSSLRIYINGELSASVARTGPIGPSTYALTIGADTMHGSYYGGLIDEVRIYNRALSSTEIQTDMSRPVGAAAKSIPLPWNNTDIGAVGTVGSAGFSNNVFTVNGAGSFNSTSDSFQFVYQPLSGDGEISAQLSSASGSAYTAGVMIREALTPNSRYAFIGASNGKMRRQRRTSTGGSSTSTSWSSANFPNVWVRLVRSGNTITRYQSADGVTWTAVDSYTGSMASEIYMGLAVASNGTTNLAKGTFSNVKATP
jgi:regulation of enolase protein 1 (concanavalin A-like superfamily)